MTIGQIVGTCLLIIVATRFHLTMALKLRGHLSASFATGAAASPGNSSMIKLFCPTCRKNVHVGTLQVDSTTKCAVCAQELVGTPSPPTALLINDPAKMTSYYMSQGTSIDQGRQEGQDHLAHTLEQLGKPTAVYKNNPVELIGVLISALIIVGTVAAVLIVSKPPIKAMLITAFVSVLISVGATVLAIRTHSHRVLVCPEGFARIRGRKVETCRWDDIESFWERTINHYVVVFLLPVPAGSTYECHVRRTDGVQFGFNRKWKRVDMLGQTIRDRTFQRMLPQAFETISSGGTAQFGSFGVSKAGLTEGKEFLPWCDFDRLDFSAASIKVCKVGKWFAWCKVEAASVPNLAVFLAVMEHVNSKELSRNGR